MYLGIKAVKPQEDLLQIACSLQISGAFVFFKVL